MAAQASKSVRELMGEALMYEIASWDRWEGEAIILSVAGVQAVAAALTERVSDEARDAFTICLSPFGNDAFAITPEDFAAFEEAEELLREYESEQAAESAWLRAAEGGMETTADRIEREVSETLAWITAIVTEEGEV